MHVYVYLYIDACIRVCMNVYKIMFVSIIMCVSGGLISRNLNYPCYKCRPMLKPRHNFVVIDTKLLIRYSKTKRRTAAYPRAL